MWTRPRWSISWKVLVSVASCVVVLLVGGVIWIPEMAHYYVSNTVITDDILEGGRRLPPQPVLSELREFTLGLDLLWSSDDDLVVAAEKMLEGRIEMPGLPPRNVKMPFDARDLDEGSSDWQLYFSGFIIPKTLLKAYEVGKREVFFLAARDFILAWASYERSAWVPKGFLWNDHAIAARVPVLAEFWRMYRHHPDYEPEVARTILQLVARSGALLARPSHFTFSTNHGVMQNLALWHLSVAFPTLPGVEQYKQLALGRLRDQYSFLISDEGVFLEHAAAYHKFGLELQGMAFRYLTLMDIAVPADWKQKYENAKDFYALLRRPDGSLPMFGDTWSGSDGRGPLVTSVDDHGRSSMLERKSFWLPPASRRLYPVSGYSIWLDGLGEWPMVNNLSQTIVAWSYFHGHGHKHADEMSVLFWAGGQTWWTNVGYWPYDLAGRREAESWGGSNAPHLAMEGPDSMRRTSLLFHGFSDDLAVIDLERVGPEQYAVRRQVVLVRPDLWAVVDSTLGKGNGRTTTIWTTSHRVKMRDGEVLGSYELRVENSNVVLTGAFLGSAGIETRRVEGSLAPFAGWEVVDGVPRPAPAIVVEQPTNDSWTVTIWSLKKASGRRLEFVDRPRMQYWGGAETWRIGVPAREGVISIGRERQRVYVDGGRRRSKEVVLARGPDVGARSAQIRAEYRRVASAYPRFTDLLAYRWRMTYFLLIALLFQETCFAIYRGNTLKGYWLSRIVSLLGWLSVGIWLDLVYFKSELAVSLARVLLLA